MPIGLDPRIMRRDSYSSISIPSALHLSSSNALRILRTVDLDTPHIRAERSRESPST